MAVVAVLLSHIDRNAVVIMKPNINLPEKAQLLIQGIVMAFELYSTWVCSGYVFWLEVCIIFLVNEKKVNSLFGSNNI